MSFRVLSALVVGVLMPTVAMSQSAIDEAWDNAREKAFSAEGAAEIMQTARAAKAPDGFRISYTQCDAGDAACLQRQAETAVDLPYAYRGAYTAQRNLAFCLNNGCEGAIVPKPELSCAWRIVIAASGHPEVGGGDTMNLEGCLKSLGASSVGIAKAQAAKIYKAVYGKALPEEWR